MREGAEHPIHQSPSCRQTKSWDLKNSWTNMDDEELPTKVRRRKKRHKKQQHEQKLQKYPISCPTDLDPVDGPRGRQPLQPPSEMLESSSSSLGRTLYTASRVELKASRLLPRPAPLPQSRWSNSSSGGGNSIGGGVASFYARLRLAGGPRRGASDALVAAAGAVDFGDPTDSVEMPRSPSLYLRPSASHSMPIVVAGDDLGSYRTATLRQSPGTSDASSAAWRSTASSFVHRQKLMKCDTPVNRALSSSNSSQSTLRRALWAASK